MPIFAIPILILLALFALSAGDDLIKNINLPVPSFQLFAEKNADQPLVPKSTAQKPSTISQAPAIFFELDTQIISGPNNNTEITDTNKITFEFEGSVDPTETAGRITFETFIEGVDKIWKSTSSRQRTITLPARQEEYTFQVRSKLGKQLDQTPAQRTFKLQVSPFFGKIDIQSARASTQDRSSLITLRPKIDNEETLDITEWKIEGENGSFKIPLGIESFEPGIHDNPINRIVLTKADTVKLSSEKSPFGVGRNFRPNICMGYIKNDYDFNISFSTSCSFQKPLSQELIFLPQHCEDFILKKINFSSCNVPQYPEDPNILRDGTAECAAYIQENFTYHSCFKKYQDTEDFTKNEWHIYMNMDFINPRYDFLKLYDNNGLLVDTKELL